MEFDAAVMDGKTMAYGAVMAIRFSIMPGTPPLPRCMVSLGSPVVANYYGTVYGLLH